MRIQLGSNSQTLVLIMSSTAPMWLTAGILDPSKTKLFVGRLIKHGIEHELTREGKAIRVSVLREDVSVAAYGKIKNLKRYCPSRRTAGSIGQALDSYFQYRSER